MFCLVLYIIGIRRDNRCLKYLTQAETDIHIAMEKQRVNDDRGDCPGLGGAIVVPLISVNKRENILLDISRGKIDLYRQAAGWDCSKNYDKDGKWVGR